ncbi:dihydropteroate synthase [Lampropedia aestuarii]|uniref:Dihydropteroate synthase n=1 Tax=Lampropedia aestuarii TaxID=2562762 RepID=A0A4S5BR05_9BURK|nr:dihydropteroate synthase [Lampropedia aestuarii]THJ32268.1 dihydropteroate synthase [Lampropedia aestuarii]
MDSQPEVVWRTSRFSLNVSRPLIMGIVNVTPDSFSDGGRYSDVRSAVAHAESLLKQGADILDLGAESTRPGSPAVPVEQELARILPVLQELVRLQVPISIDTYKAEVMRASLDLGADIINDIWALRQPGALQAVSAHPDCGVCLMHMHKTPQDMQVEPMQGDVLQEVWVFLQQQAKQLESAGVAADRIVLDPGIGFGKTVEQNFLLLAKQAQLLTLGYPVLAGWSRKSSIGAVTGLEVEHRATASVVAAVLAVEHGARIVRVHDVRATAEGLKVWGAMQAANAQ